MSKITDLATALRKLLESGFYPVGARFPSEYELMERYNVARLTANKAVALLTAEGLLERGRRGSGTFVRCCRKFPQGWIAAFMDVASPYNAAMIAGAANTAMLNNYMLSIFNPRMPEITDALKKLEQSDCIGVLTGGYGILPATLSKPVIYMDVEIDDREDGPHHNVTCDNYGAAHEMMSRVLAAGFRKVVTVTLPNHQHRRKRLQGFKDAMQEHGIDNIEERCFVFREKDNPYEMRQIMRRIMQKFPDVEYILTDSDDIVLQIIRISKSENIECPNRIKITGFGNIYGISGMHKLPTVDQHPWHIGNAAVTALLQSVNGGYPDEVIKIEVPAEVINTEFI